jgi:hypothetical protein
MAPLVCADECTGLTQVNIASAAGVGNGRCIVGGGGNELEVFAKEGLVFLIL